MIVLLTVGIQVPAEIVSVRENEGIFEYYIHYLNYNRRLDEWITIDRMNLKELTGPTSSNSSSSSNLAAHDVATTNSSRSTATVTTTANGSNDNISKNNNANVTAPTTAATSTGTTTTFVLSDDADSLNSDLSRAATMPSTADNCMMPATPIVPTQVRGNGNPHHSGAHSVTKVKNINMIHLGRYFIKPWYFSPYPEVNSILMTHTLEINVTLFQNVNCRN